MRKLNKQKLFNFISILFLSFLIIFFGARLIYNYLDENGNKEVTSSLLSDTIIRGINKENIQYSNTYKIVGNTESNYVLYSGILWRVVEVDNGNIKLVSSDSLTILPWGNGDYSYSNINKWLNESLLTNLTNINDNLLDFSACLIKTNEIKTSECTNDNSKISLLTLNDYIVAGGNNSYLNNNEYYWLSSTNVDTKPWYVFEEGGTSVENENHLYGVRAVIVLKDRDYIYGNGTFDNPYMASNEPVNTLYEAELGSYIKYSGYEWKIVSKQDDSIKVVMTSSLKENEKFITKKYSNNYNYFNLNDKTGIAYYLNNTFYKSLENKKYLKKGTFNIGTFKNYNYNELTDKKLEGYVGLLTVGDIYLNNNKDMYLLSTIVEGNTIPVLKKNSTIYYDFKTYESEIRPVIYLDNSLEIVNGIGNENYPFELR